MKGKQRNIILSDQKTQNDFLKIEIPKMKETLTVVLSQYFLNQVMKTPLSLQELDLLYI